MRNSLVLVRPNPSPVPREIIDLADEALDIGYKVLANRVQRVSAFHEGAAILKGIGVNVFDQKSVEWYQRVAIFKVRYFMYAQYLIYPILLLPAAYGLARLSMMFKDPSFPAVAFGLLAAIMLCLSITSLIAYIVRTATLTSHYNLSWDTQSIMSYDKPVPEDVLRTAIAIRDALPKSELVVEELRAKKRVVDPFLFVVYKEVRLYVAVWDEPKFTGLMR